MNRKHFLILAGITLAVALLAVFLSQRQRPATLADSQTLLYPALLAAINDVAEIAVHGKDEQFTLLRQENAWGLKEKALYPVDLEKVRKLLLGLAELRAKEPMTSKPENYAKLGVNDVTEKDAASVLITLKSAQGATLADLLVGHQQPAKSDPARSEVYVRKNGEAQSWLALGSLPAGGKTLDWVRREILDVSVDRVRRVEVTQADGGALHVVKDKSDQPTFELAEMPEGQKLKSPYELFGVASTLSGLMLEDVKPAAELDFASLPQTRAVFDTLDGLRVTLRVAQQEGKYYAAFSAEAQPEAADAPPQAGEPAAQPEAQPEDPLVQAREEAAALNTRLSAWVYQIPAYKAQNLEKKPAELLEPKAAPGADAAPADAFAQPGTASPAQLIETLGK